MLRRTIKLSVSSPGGVIRVLCAFARHGFAGVDIKFLNALASVLDVELDSGVPKAEAREALALALVLRVLDNVDEASATTIMVDGLVLSEPPSEDYLGDVTDEMMWDFALVGEQVEVVDLLKSWAKGKAIRAEKRERVLRSIAASYPKSSHAAHEGRKKSATKAAEAKAAKTLVDQRQRFFADLQSQAREVVEREAPPLAHVHVDTGNGCFRVKMPGTSVKSFSWTKRGESEAARLTLSQLWSWHSERTGSAPPAYLQL